MSNDKNVAASVDNMGDNLEQINGIGPASAGALNKIGIYRPADFLSYKTHEELHQALDKAGAKIPLKKIEKDDWLGQANAIVLAQQENPVFPSTLKNTESASESDQPSSKEEWEQYAGFNLYFEFRTSEGGQQEWRTHVFKTLDPHDPDRINGSEEFPGIEPTLWINWMLEQANLPITPKVILTKTEVTTEPTATETEEAVPPPPMIPSDTRIEILDVQLSEIEPSSGVPEKRLRAEARFKVVGPEAETLAAERIPFRVEIHTVALEGETSTLVTSGLEQLQPQMVEYTSQQAFPIPEPGRYELHSLVLLLPPREMMAYHRGPTFKVVP